MAKNKGNQGVPPPSSPYQPPSKLGTHYVASPRQTPALRPLRQSIYDRERVGGHIEKSIFFCDNKKTADGRNKDQHFTNLWQSGCLGYPLEMDIVAVSVSPVLSAIDSEYAKSYRAFIGGTSVLKVYFVANTVWHSSPLSMMTPKTVRHVVVLEDGKPALRYAEPPDLPSKFINMKTLDNKARRVGPTESFRIEIETDDPAHAKFAEIDVLVSFDGILYQGL